MAETEPADAGAHAVATARGRAIWARLWQAVRAVATSEVGAKFRLRFASILALLLGIAGLNVVNSYVGRNLFTAIEQRNIATFVSMTALWIAVFAALTTAAVIHAGGSWNLRAYSSPLAASAGGSDARLDIRGARSEVMGAT